MNKVEPKTLSGFMELYPNEQVAFDKMKNVIENIYKKYGFYPIDTPIIEYSEVLLAKAGGETEKQIYRFDKGDNDLSLRFDLTVPLAKYVSKRSNELFFPFKRYQIGKVFRGERPQKGRFREFYQCDIDVIGDGELSLKYDSEIPCIIYDIFSNLNIGDFVIEINNRKILNGFFESLNLSSKVTEILRIIDKLDKIGINSVISELKNIDITENAINKIIDFINISGSIEEKLYKLNNLEINNLNYKLGVEELTAVIKNLNEMRFDYKFLNINLTVARGLDYYTGTVYETKLLKYPSIGSVCSGGRYDNLAEFYTDRSLPGVGVSIGLTRLFYQLKEASIISCENVGSSDTLIIPMCSNNYYVYDIANFLRNNDISVNICHLEKNFKKKMKFADHSNVKYIIIIGDDEVKENLFTLKNMQDGNQEKLSKEELLNRLLKYIK